MLSWILKKVSNIRHEGNNKGQDSAAMIQEFKCPEPRYIGKDGELAACAWRADDCGDWKVFSALDMGVFMFAIDRLMYNKHDIEEIRSIMECMRVLEKPKEVGMEAAKIYAVLARNDIFLKFSFSRKWEILYKGLPIQIDSVKENFFNKTTT